MISPQLYLRNFPPTYCLGEAFNWLPVFIEDTLYISTVNDINMLFCVDITDALIVCVHCFQGRILQRNAQDGAADNSEVEKTKSGTFFPSATPHYIKTRFSLQFCGYFRQASVLQSYSLQLKFTEVVFQSPDLTWLFFLSPGSLLCSQQRLF